MDAQVGVSSNKTQKKLENENLQQKMARMTSNVLQEKQIPVCVISLKAIRTLF